MHPAPGTEAILVVNEVPSSVSEIILSRYGYTVLVADSGKAALDLLGRPELIVDLALIDIIMPEVNGIEFAARVAEMRPELPILFCTGDSEREELRTFLARFPYITKPFTSVTLTRRIRELLDKPRADGAPGQS